MVRTLIFACLVWSLAPIGMANTYPLPPEGENVIGEIAAVTARYEDTLLDIARRYDLGYQEIISANPGIDPWLPGEGTKVILPTKFILPAVPRQGIVINVPEMRLYYYPKPVNGELPVVVTHPLGVGREGWETPLGKTQVLRKIERPSWYPPASIRKEHEELGDPLPRIVPAGPDNPLGEFALYLGFKGYLIHGTNRPYGVGMRVSHGCIRMYPEDIATLFEQVPKGTPVNIVHESYKVGIKDGKHYFEAIPRAEGEKPIAQEPLAQLLADRLGQTVKKLDFHRIIETVNAAAGLVTAIDPAPAEKQVALIQEHTPPPSPAAKTPDLEKSSDWFVQVGHFTNSEEALRLAAMLKHLGPPIPAHHWTSNLGHRVLAGPFGNQNEALTASRRIQKDLGISVLLLAPVVRKP